MPAISGNFSGTVRTQTSFSVPDQPGHELRVAETSGTQRSSDEKWNNATMTYWGVSDTLEGQGTQRGYFFTQHAGEDRDWGTFEGQVRASGSQIIVEGSWQFTGGSGSFKGLTGSGTFRTTLTPPASVEASWQGTYELAIAKAQAG
jgi:hypothetical protein